MKQTHHLTLAVFVALLAVSAHADVSSYYVQSDWLTTVGGGTNGLTVFSFQGPTETNGEPVNSTNIQPSYASQGVVILPFRGTSIYPIITRGQQFQISAPNHDGLLVNSTSTNATSDLEGRAIDFNFIVPVRAVGLNFNGPGQGGDGGYLEAYDSSSNLIGQTSVCAAGGFVGLVADTEIAQIHVVNTFNGDIIFGIWDLQFKEVPVSLAIGSLQSSAIISWPATAQNYILQSASDLTAANWLTVTNSTVVENNSLTVQVSTVSGTQFYRLKRLP